MAEALTAADYASLEARWITREVADAAFLRRVHSLVGAEMMGQVSRAGDYGGILIPYLWPGEEHIRDYRLRRDHPEREQRVDGSIAERRKYLSPPGRGNMLYLPPAAESAWLDDAGMPMVIVEGEFKTLALWRLAWHSRGDTAEAPAFLPVGLQGVYSWRGVVGKISDSAGNREDLKGPVPDLGRIAWQDRRIVIVFDPDVDRNLNVADARRRLTRELESRGAEVAWLRWPAELAEKIKGIDDFLADRGPEQALKLLARSKTVTRRRKTWAAAEVIADWKAALIHNDNGGIKPILANAITALKTAPELAGMLAFDEFSLRILATRGSPWHGDPFDWSDVDDIRLAEWMQREGIHVSALIANQAVDAVAREHKYHPVRDYLTTTAWDGVERIDRWLSEYFGVTDSAYSRAVGRRWLISAVARIMQPGCQVDHCLILEGEQGVRKSTALRVMAGEWFTDDMHELGTKDSAMQIHGVWIVELAELDAMSRGELSQIKAFLVRRVDHFRPPFGRRTADFARQCVFAGSVNHSTYLRDETGGRRFWPVVTGAINIARLEEDRDQIWAEARVRYENNESWWLESAELASVARDEQDVRYERDPWDEMIWDFVEGARKAWVERGKPEAAFVISGEEILRMAIQKKPDQWTPQDRHRVARVLRSRGLKYIRQRVVDDDGNAVLRPDGTQEREYRYCWPRVN
jgi:predicted P-loop ATPase